MATPQLTNVSIELSQPDPDQPDDWRVAIPVWGQTLGLSRGDLIEALRNNWMREALILQVLEYAMLANLDVRTCTLAQLQAVFQTQQVTLLN